MATVQYNTHPFSNQYVNNAFSRKTLGPTGLIGQNNRIYTFLKSSPYAETGTGGNTHDPVSRKVFESRSLNYRNKREALYDQVDKTKRQIRYNEFTRSGASVPRHHGFQYTSDYHRLIVRDQSQQLLKVLIGGAIVYLVFVR